jgi:tetraacyldisaccharide 4'-kinase
MIVSLRNWCYDSGYFSVYQPPVKTICVGNLSVGGTGKSPMIEYLIRQFSTSYNIAVLSRGYKRKTKGCVEVQPTMTVAEVGDEPLQFKKKFNDIKVFVEANRTYGIKTILNTYPEVNLILLDDAFQHRKVKAHHNILLTTFSKPYFKDYILPVGWLRESRLGAKRAQSIVVTKCPDDLGESTKAKYISRIQPTPNQQVLFSKIQYSNNIYTTDKHIELKDFDNFYLITGIANPKPMLDFLKQQHKNFEHLDYPDHHNFTTKDLAKINALKKPILTTEKDFMRLANKVESKIYYLPIEVELDGELKFF